MNAPLVIEVEFRRPATPWAGAVHCPAEHDEPVRPAVLMVAHQVRPLPAPRQRVALEPTTLRRPGGARP